MFVMGNIDNTEEREQQVQLNDKEKNVIGNNNYVMFSLEDVLAGGTGYIENTLIFNKTGKQTIVVFFSYKDKVFLITLSSEHVASFPSAINVLLLHFLYIYSRKVH